MKVTCEARYDRLSGSLELILQDLPESFHVVRIEERTDSKVRLTWAPGRRLCVMEATEARSQLDPIFAHRVGAEDPGISDESLAESRVWQGVVELEFRYDPSVDAACLELDNILRGGDYEISDPDAETDVIIDVDVDRNPLRVEFLDTGVLPAEWPRLGRSLP